MYVALALILLVITPLSTGKREWRLSSSQEKFIEVEIEKHTSYGGNQNPTVILPPIAFTSANEDGHCVYPIIIWDPLLQFGENVKYLKCPFCTLKKVGSNLNPTSIWNDGSTRRRRPRTIFDSCYPVLLVSRVYRCGLNSNHVLSAIHPEIISQLEKFVVHIMFELTHQIGYTRSLSETLCKMIDSGLPFRRVADILMHSYEGYTSCFSDSGINNLESVLTPSRNILEDIFISSCYSKEEEYKYKMSKTTASWLSADHTFKAVMNIGYSRSSDNKWIKLYISLFCILNEKGQILKWQFTKTTKSEEVQEIFQELALRLKQQGKNIDAIYIDNCCQLREKLKEFFDDDSLSVKLDLFHAINRFTSTISQRHPLKKRITREYRNIFRSPGDYGKKRHQATPGIDTLLQNLKSFKSRWTKFRFKRSTVLNKKSLKALKNIEKHIRKGCLSDILPGCGTNKNERMHKKLKRLTKRNRIGLHLAYALFLRTFDQINGGIDGDKGDKENYHKGYKTGESFGFQAPNNEHIANDSQDFNLEGDTQFTDEILTSTLKRSILISNHYKSLVVRGFDENYADLIPKMLNFKEFQGRAQLKDPKRLLFSTEVLRERASRMNFNIAEVPGDGDCFFSSVALQLITLFQNSPKSFKNHVLQLGVPIEGDVNAIATFLRQLLVQEWLSHHERYIGASQLDFSNFIHEANSFLTNGHYASVLGNAMPLGMANALQVPLVLITSAENWPLTLITPEEAVSDVPLYLAFDQEGEHYDALTECGKVVPEQQVEHKEKKQVRCRCGVNYKGKEPKMFCSSKESTGGKRKYSSRCACLKQEQKCGNRCKCKHCGNRDVKMENRKSHQKKPKNDI